MQGKSKNEKRPPHPKVPAFPAWLPRVETRYQFQQLPWRTLQSKWGQLGKAAIKPRWPGGANGAGAKMGKKGETDLVQRSTLRCPHLVRPRVCCPLISTAEKEAPYSGKSQSRPPCYTPAAAFLLLTAPCHQGRVVQALPHTTTASLPDLLLRATG